MTKIILQTIGVILLLVYLGSAGFLYGIGSNEPCYRGIEVNIADSTEQQFLSSRDILRQINAAQIRVVGLPYDEVNTQQLSKMLEENRLIRKAYCYHTPDSLLRIDIEQRHPIIRIKSNTAVTAGQQRLSDFYIDREGELMPYEFGASSPTPLPLVTGSVSLKHAQEDLFRLAKYMQGNRFWRDMITQFYMHPNGDLEFVTRVGSTSVLIGQVGNTDESYSDFEDRMDNVKKFYQKVLPRKGWNAYSHINAKFKGRVFGEKRS